MKGWKKEYYERHGSGYPQPVAEWQMLFDRLNQILELLMGKEQEAPCKHEPDLTYVLAGIMLNPSPCLRCGKPIEPTGWRLKHTAP